MNGFTFNLEILYPKISYPVSRGTPTISPLIKWNHSQDWFVASFGLDGGIKNGENRYSVNVLENEWNYLSGHVIDGK